MIQETRRHASGRLQMAVACRTLVLVVLTTSVGASEALEVVRPTPYQVVQRFGFDARLSRAHAAGTDAWGAAIVEVRCRGTVQNDSNTVLEARTTLLPGCQGTALDWTAIPFQRAADELTGSLRLPAGGWYRLELRLRVGEETKASSAVEPVGVGEVFLIAGQSYAAGANDELLRLNDPAQRAAALDLPQSTWQAAHDPQPDVGDGGTIWPAMADELLPIWQVPIGLVNVSVGATSVRQWLPDDKLFARLVEAGQRAGGFRAVLWQQGESDVIEKTSTDEYVQRLETIRAAAAAKWQAEPAWLLAKSTLHPTVYNDAGGEGRIRAAIERLWRMPGFHRGPDTDLLDGANRGDASSRRHFTGPGQRRAGRMWAGSLLTQWEGIPAVDCASQPWIPQRVAGGQRYATFGPPPAQPSPTLVVLALGLDDMQAKPVYSQLARKMAAAGWCCLTIDPPCHGDDRRPGEPEGLPGWRHRLEQGEPFVDKFVRRAQAVLDDAVARGWCDPRRVAASGTSRGGFCALHLARADRRIQAVVGFAPVSDLSALDEFIEIQVAPGLQALALANYADDLADRKLWITIGNRDERVDTARAVQFCDAVVEAAARRGLPAGAVADVELSITASPGHAVSPDAYRRAADWLRREFPDW